MSTIMNDTADVTDLLHRSGDGKEIALLWQRSTGALTLHIVDLVDGWITEFDVAPERASHAFQHPFAYWYEQQVGCTPSLAA